MVCEHAVLVPRNTNKTLSVTWKKTGYKRRGFTIELACTTCAMYKISLITEDSLPSWVFVMHHNDVDMG